MSNVIKFTGGNCTPLTVKEVLKEAKKRKFDMVVVIGWHEKTDEFNLSSVGGSNADALWALEQGKRALLEGDEDEIYT